MKTRFIHFYGVSIYLIGFKDGNTNNKAIRINGRNFKYKWQLTIDTKHNRFGVSIDKPSWLTK